MGNEASQRRNRSECIGPIAREDVLCTRIAATHDFACPLDSDEPPPTIWSATHHTGVIARGNSTDHSIVIHRVCVCVVMLKAPFPCLGIGWD